MKIFVKLVAMVTAAGAFGAVLVLGISGTFVRALRDASGVGADPSLGGVIRMEFVIAAIGFFIAGMAAFHSRARGAHRRHHHVHVRHQAEVRRPKVAS